MNNIFASISNIVNNKSNEWIEHRRALHAKPELGWLEFQTTNRIISALESMALNPLYGRAIHVEDARMGMPDENEISLALLEAIDQGINPTRAEQFKGGFTGVVCDIMGAKPGPVRAWRCDIDGLPIMESDSEEHRPIKMGFASCRTGCMHACGHDVHTAIGLGLAEVLSSLRKELRGTVRLIFQPAEEGVRGARSMIAAGMADGIEEFYSGHVGVKVTQLGELVCGWNNLLATTKWDIAFKGRAAHAGIEPEKGADALAAACHAVVTLKSVVPTFPVGIRLNVGVLQGGVGRNIIAPSANMQLEGRALLEHEHEQLRVTVENILRSSCEAFRVACEIKTVGFAPAADSDKRATEKVMAIANELDSWVSINQTQSNYGACDDATAWMQAVRKNGGIAAFLGFGSPTGTGHHSPMFDIDEKVIPAAVELLARLFLS